MSLVAALPSFLCFFVSPDFLPGYKQPIALDPELQANICHIQLQNKDNATYKTRVTHKLHSAVRVVHDAQIVTIVQKAENHVELCGCGQIRGCKGPPPSTHLNPPSVNDSNLLVAKLAVQDHRCTLHQSQWKRNRRL